MPYTPRTISVIKAQILGQVSSYPALSALQTSISQVAKYGLWAFITAVGISLLEQLMASFQSDLEATIAAAPVGSEPWLQAKSFEFQYDAITPQLLTLVGFAPVYNPVNVSKRIITRCAVNTSAAGAVTVKVAKQEPPVALTTPELVAFKAYLTDGGNGTFAGRSRAFGFAGINILPQSFTSDKLFIAGTIYFNGQYAATIQATVIAAINSYLAALPFDGSVSLIGITDAIQAVGLAVNDISLTDIAIRPDATLFANKIFLRQGKTDIYTTYPTFAGYAVQETTAGQTFADQLIFLAS